MSDKLAGGAFIEIDEHKLDKGQMFLLGAQHTLDELVAELAQKSDEASAPDCPSPFIRATLVQIVERLVQRRDVMAVALTRSAIKSGAATMNNADGKRIQ